MNSLHRGLRALLLALLLPCISVAAPDSTRQLFDGGQVPAPNERQHVMSFKALEITTAVPSRDETREIFGADLYRNNVQPVWVQLENRSDKAHFLAPMGVDPAYFAPRESARRADSGGAIERYNDTFDSSTLRFWVAPNSMQSGYIFTRVDEGTKSFNLDVFSDGAGYRMSFFIPVPGLKLDHYDIDFKTLYPADQLRPVNLQQLVAELEHLPCCVRDKRGEATGDPLNLVFVGDIKDLYYGFMRAGWDETETIHAVSLFKTSISALTGGRYRYSPVSALYVFGRPQDAAFQRARSSIHARNHLRVWLTPLRLDGVPVWIGQISRDIGVRFTTKTITTHKIDPDVDETREFLLEDLAYSQALKKFGYVGGIRPSSYEQPASNLTGDSYFTNGQRIVMWMSSQPTAISDIEILDLSPYHTGHVAD